MKNLAPLFFLILFSFSCSTTGNKKYETIPFIGTTVVYKKTLNNGLKILVIEDHSSPTFAYQTWFQVGSRDEKEKYTGLAHLFEHMMFKGTKTRKEGEFDKILESNGAEGENAFTSRDYTAYVQEMPKDKLELIAELEADRMVNLIVNDQSFKTEREVVQNERRFRNENSPDGLLYQEIFQLSFQKHSYRWPVIGYEEDLARMSAKDGEDFYKNNYSPERATVVVVGDVNANRVFDVIEKYYGNLKSKNLTRPTPPREPKQIEAKHKTLKLNVQVEKLMASYHVPEITHHDAPAIYLFRALLSSGKSSRLYKKLVDAGISTSVGVYDGDDKDPSLLIVFSNLQKGKKASQAESILLEEIKKIQTTLVSDQELERAKNALKFEFYESISEPEGKAHYLGHYETVTPSFLTGLKMVQKIDAVTPEQIIEVANKYFYPNNRTVLYGVPK